MRRYLTWAFLAIGFLALVAVGVIGYRYVVDDEPVGLDDIFFWLPSETSSRTSDERSWGFGIGDSARIVVEIAEADVRVVKGDSGNVTVTGWLVRQAADPQSYEINAEMIGSSTLQVSAHPTVEWNPSIPGRARITISVPEECSVSIETRRGSVLIEEIMGRKGIRVNGGDILVNGGGGEFYLITRHGGIMIERYKGGGTVETERGEVALSLVEGNVSVTATEQVVVSAHFGALSAATQRGRIVAELLRPDSACTLTTIDGDIELSSISGTGLYLDVSSPPGGIRNGFQLDPLSRISPDSSRLIGTTNGGGINIVVRTSDGMVKLGNGGE